MVLRFIIVSDTHGVREPMQELYERYPNDGMIHLGDHLADARWMLQRTAGHPVYAVKGNCDYGAEGPEDQLLELGGLKILLMHGHRFGVKSGYGGAWAEAKRRGAQVLLFGHTHQAYYNNHNGLAWLNPGSIGMSILNGSSYGVLTIEGDKIRPEVRFVARGIL